MRKPALAVAGIAAAMLFAAGSAQAQCVSYGANATAGTEDSSKWYVMETMVQQLSWGLWPGWVANGSLPGYRITSQRYVCTGRGTSSVFCRGRATFCKT